ncbi:MAG: helix-turn-helix transcriptional regulator [Methanobacterium sp.]
MNPEDIFRPYNKISEDLKFITASDIKIKILISLKNGPKKLPDLKKDIHVNSSTILHNIRQLESKDIILKEFQQYSLSQTGEIITHNLISFLNSIYFIKNQKKFWLEHKIESIPPNLINYMECLRDIDVCTIKSSYSILEELLKKSNNIKCIFSYPIYGDKLFKIICEENNHFKALLAGEYTSLECLKNKNFHLLDNENLGLNLIILEEIIFLNISYLNGMPDKEYCLMGKSKEGIKWGTKLFDYYLSQSEF